MSSVALTEQTRRDATQKTTMRLKILKVGPSEPLTERITPWLGPLREACQPAPRTTPASSDHCDSPDSRHAVFLLSESQLSILRFRQWGRAAGGISAVKTATATTNWQKWWRVAIELERGQDLPWVTVWLDADGADQPLTLPVGRVIFLFEAIRHSFQRQVCLALRRRILVSVISAMDKTSRRYSRSQRYKAIGRVP